MSVTNNSNPLDRLPDPIINAIAVLGIALGVGLGIGFHQSITASQPVVAITEAQYERINPGMTLTDVRAIVGDGVEVRRSESSAEFEWSSVGGKTITGTFEQGRLVEKSQSIQRK
ncbi:MAG: hypothetical protein AAFZ17_01410 [Cyanobacteria bacterium J06650_10]